MHLKVGRREVFGGRLIDGNHPGKPEIWSIGYVVEAMERPRWITFPSSRPLSLKTFGEARLVSILDKITFLVSIFVVCVFLLIDPSVLVCQITVDWCLRFLSILCVISRFHPRPGLGVCTTSIVPST